LGRALAEYGFRSKEAAWREGDALESDGCRGIFRLLCISLLGGDGGLEDLVAGLQVRDCGIQSRRSALDLSRGVHRLGGPGAGVRCARIC
jgi:hypothetical protein